MDRWIKPSIQRVHKDYCKLGILYGILAGLVFALCVWSIDALELAHAHALTPALRLILGVLYCMLIGGIAGFVTARQNNLFIGLLVWSVAGLAFAWFTVHLPFEISSKIIGYLDPRFEGLDLFPLYPTFASRFAVLALIVSSLSTLSGAFEFMVLDAVRTSPSMLGRVIISLLGVPFFVMAGFVSDGMINKPMRDPLIAIDQLIRFSLDHQNQPVDRDTALRMHLASLQTIEEFIERSRKISLGNYDKNRMTSSTVEIDFNGTWVRCTVINKNPLICIPTLEKIQQGMICLARDEENCPVIPTHEAQIWLVTHREIVNERSTFKIEVQRGAILLLSLDAEEGSRYLCQFRGTQPIVFETCHPY